MDECRDLDYMIATTCAARVDPFTALLSVVAEVGRVRTVCAREKEYSRKLMGIRKKSETLHSRFSIQCDSVRDV